MLDPEKVEVVKQRIRLKHQDDGKQLEVIFSVSSRILVEAPAGYGKTATMVSKIAYMIAIGQIPNPKRLLALTFSVNAAYKIKKDVAQQVPTLLAGLGITIDLSDKIFVSNYHGFCRNVLKKYGYLFHSNLTSIDTIQSIDDSSIEGVQKAFGGISFDDAEFLSKFTDALKNNDTEYLDSNFDDYCSLIISDLLPNRIISYNGIIALTIKLFNNHPNILEFYQKYFTSILVDEYQDTNSLSFRLIDTLITTSTRIILLGDSLQRIYGFIGAVPDLLTISEQKFSLTKIPLIKNYRFASNPQMLQLDSNIRRNAERPRTPIIKANARIDLTIFEDQDEEAAAVVAKAVELSTGAAPGKVAILVKQRGPNINSIISIFDSEEISFFYGLFTDEQPDYILFHRKCLFEFIELLRTKNHVTKKLASDHLIKMRELDESPTALSTALLDLLEIFWKKIFSDFSSFSNEDKIVLIKDTFENNGLKQYVEFVTSNIVISTVHGAKGLEWDYVILPDLEQDSFPNWVGMCGNCDHRRTCELQISAKNEVKFLEELSVFYVAVTRSRKQVFFTASNHSVDNQGRKRSKNLSCLLSIAGIEY